MSAAGCLGCSSTCFPSLPAGLVSLCSLVSPELAGVCMTLAVQSVVVVVAVASDSSCWQIQ